MRTDIGLLVRPGLAHGAEHFEREAQAVVQRAAVFVGALVGQRRDEARQQIAVRGVQLDHVEARALAALHRLHEIGDHRVHVGARHLARHLAVRIIGQRRRRHDRPARLAAAAGPCPPTSAWSRPCARHGRAAGRTSLPELAWTKSTMRFQAASWASLYIPVQPGRDARSSGHAGHLGEHQAGAADRARAVVHHVPVGRHAVDRRILVTSATPRRDWRSVMSRSRNGWNIGGDGLRGVDLEALRLRVARHHLVGRA